MILGMIPQLNGIGNGYDFIKSGMDFAIDFYNPETIQISIECFNNAIKLFKDIKKLTELCVSSKENLLNA